MAERSAFLDLVDERVVVYDGAFGTYMQEQNLTADDFGGPDLEGCNEILVLSRPDLVAGMHEAFFGVGVDVVETATFGAFAVPLNEYGVGDKTHEINLKAPRSHVRWRLGTAGSSQDRSVLARSWPAS